jgi:tetratricopeptide (TPR) repeat protein
VLQAIDSAHLLMVENQQREAGILLQAALAVYEEPYRLAALWQSTGKAQVLAMLGEKQAAINELQSLVDNGWRIFWRWDTEFNPNLKTLHDDAEFQAIVEFLRTDMARQRESLQVLERAGEIPPPPGGDDW